MIGRWWNETMLTRYLSETVELKMLWKRERKVISVLSEAPSLLDFKMYFAVNDDSLKHFRS